MFLAALALTATTRAWALEPNADGIYEIGSADDLRAFATLVNETDPTASAKLTADISYTENHVWIGTSGYEGTFDGQGHTITIEGDYSESTAEKLALFYRVAQQGVVKNLNTAGTLKSGGKHMAGIAGNLTGGRISHCSTSMTLVSLVEGDCTSAGIVGEINKVNGSVIEYCAVTGCFIGEKATHWGGIAGWSNNTTTIQNCLFVADVSQTLGSEHTWSRNPGKVTVKNCYYLNVLGTASGGTQVTEEQLRSGEVCYLLNSTSTETHWFQNIGTDALPTLDTTHAKVYANGRKHCNGDNYEGLTIFSNSDAGTVVDDHQFEHGVCSYCGTAQADYLTPAADGAYELASADDVLWFAAIVNSGVKSDANARLSAPIDFEGRTQVPIGCTTSPYTGTFDGQLQPIRNVSNMFFGSVKGATISGVAIESGTVNVPNKTYADHAGTIIGYALYGDNINILSNSFSRANISVTSGGDAGGVAGKFYGIIRNCYYAGTIDAQGSTSCGGFLGSTYEHNYATDILNSYVYVSSLPQSKYGGAFVGYLHRGCSLTRCYGLENGSSWPSSQKNGTITDCESVTEDDFVSGRVCYLLNGSAFSDVTYYQSLGNDNTPNFDSTHGIVFPDGSGYSSATPEDYEALRNLLMNELLQYGDQTIAYQPYIDALLDATEALYDVEGRDAFMQAYAEALPMVDLVRQSAEAYQSYMQTVEETRLAAEQSGVGGTDMDILMDYFQTDALPNETYPNGTYRYIIDARELTNEELAEEAIFVGQLLETAIKTGYKAGDEITRLLVNPNFTDGFNGWEETHEGGSLGTGGAANVLPTAEARNTTFRLSQTLSGLADGYYEVRVNATFRPADDVYNQNHAAWLFANDGETLIMTESEDIIAEAEAQDLVNCYITEGATDRDLEFFGDDIFGYAPAGLTGCSYAFSAGRYENRIVAHVTGGELTLGIDMPGTGCSGDWLGFANFRLFYLGQDDSPQVLTGLDEMLAGMTARANTLIGYHGDSFTYAAQPEFSSQLRQELQTETGAIASATTVQEKADLGKRFAQTFRQIYSCKKAYAQYMAAVQEAFDMATGLVKLYPELLEQFDDMEHTFSEVIGVKWAEGKYTEAEALAMDELHNLAIFQKMQEYFPAQVDGVYQLATAADLQWLSAVVAIGLQYDAEITAPIDLTGIEWEPIGNPSSPFTGSFDGHLYPITGISNMLFGTIQGAQIRGIALESGTIDVDSQDYATHAGTIVGATLPAAPSTLSHSYSLVSITNTGGGDTGGLAGKFYGDIDHCYYAGTITGSSTAGGLIGSSHEHGYTTQISNSFSYLTSLSGVKYVGALVGYLHRTCSITNSYALEGIGQWPRGNGDGGVTIDENIHALTPEQFASGEAAWLLNEQTDEEPTFFQTLGEDQYPVLAESHGTVIRNEDDTYGNLTGIEGIQNSKSENQNADVIYDLSGRRVEKAVKGIYIVNGKKVLK